MGDNLKIEYIMADGSVAEFRCSEIRITSAYVNMHSEKAEGDESTIIIKGNKEGIF